MSEHTARVALLRGVPALSDIPGEDLEHLAGRLRRHELSRGERLSREGEAADRLFVIESGSLSVLKTGERGLLVEIAVLGPQAVAGEISLLTTPVRTATLEAREPTVVWSVGHDEAQAFLDEHPAIARPLLGHLGRRVEENSGRIARLLTRDADPRLRVVVFDSKPYIEEVFRARNRFDYNLTFLEPRLSRDTVALVEGAKVVCAFVNDQVDAEVVREMKAQGVELLALRCAGYNNVDLDACRRHGITVVRVPAYSPQAVAEHAVALMLTLNRNTHRAYSRVRESNFALTGLVGFDMHGKTVGVVGAGRIGRAVIDILGGFGCRVLVFDTFRDDTLAARGGVRYVELDELFRESDIVTLHAPLNPATHHLVDAEAIAGMKPGVMLINTSRGALIDTQALITGLKTGHVGYAGLDVYEEENAYFFEDRSDQVLTDDVLARLMTFRNVLITGHQGFLTREALENIADVTLENIHAYIEGEQELANAVA